MNLEVFLVGILPIFVFVLVDYYAGARRGALLAIVFALLWLAFVRWRTGEIDSLGWLEFFLIVTLGGVAAWMDNSTFFKFQPVVVGGVLAVVFLYYQFFDQPLMVRMLPRMAKMMAPEQQVLVQEPRMVAIFAKASLHLAFVLIGHAGFVAYAATKRSTIYWMWARLVIYPLVIVMFIIEGFLARS